MGTILNVMGKRGSPQGVATIGDATFTVALGRNGVIPEAEKREGDGCTPLGTYKVLYGLYRPDRVEKPAGNRLWWPLRADMGWCDAALDPCYNQLVPLGYSASHEQLWRDDSAYDRFLVISHNLPALPEMGSAVFVHQLHPGTPHTAGCVALQPADFTAMLALGVATIEITEAATT